MPKDHIRSIRYSDDIAEVINAQVGDTFTEKFENLVYRCRWELPAKESQLQALNVEIETKRELVRQLTDTYRALASAMNALAPQISALESAVEKASRIWEEKP